MSNKDDSGPQYSKLMISQSLNVTPDSLRGKQIQAEKCVWMGPYLYKTGLVKTAIQVLRQIFANILILFL